jgi:uncharacterized membrane protein YjgN (DUF898 family)
MDYKTSIPFEFRGDGRSYFRIWIVNLFLSVITLGIYSAWAKVRSNRYFYSHLLLDGTSFEYMANPINILKGRVVAVLLFGSYSLVSQYTPMLSAWFLLMLIAVIPWIMLKSLQFRARNSAYRNIRFRFHGTYLQALLYMGIYPAIIFMPFLVGPLLPEEWMSLDGEIAWGPVVLALWVLPAALCMGFVLQRYYRYVVTNSSYGTTRFEFHSTSGEYLLMLGKIVLAQLGLMVLLIALVAIVSGAMVGFGLPPIAAIYGTTIVGMLLYVWMIAMFMSGTTNLLYGGIVIPGSYTCRSKASAWGFFKVYFINTLYVVLTLGLYIPFAKIRLLTFRLSCLEFVTTRSLDAFVFDNDEDVAAMGQEMVEMFDLGLSL